jgi:hypothetical protein
MFKLSEFAKKEITDVLSVLAKAKIKPYPYYDGTKMKKNGHTP